MAHQVVGRQGLFDHRQAEIVQPAEAVFPAQTPLQEVLPAVVDGYVILVSEAGRPVGILTKIDVLDFIAQRT